MLRSAAVVCSLVLLSGCGEAPMGASEGASSVPADAPASAPPGPDFTGDFNLIGTEPFWGGTIRAGELTLSRAGQPGMTVANPGVKALGDVGTWSAGALVFRLDPEPCSDGMSDRRYGYRAEATFQGQVLRGCAATPAELAGQPRP